MPRLSAASWVPIALASSMASEKILFFTPFGVEIDSVDCGGLDINSKTLLERSSPLRRDERGSSQLQKDFPMEYFELTKAYSKKINSKMLTNCQVSIDKINLP